MDTANNRDLSAGLNLNTGDIVECTVEQIMPYGAFVKISENGRKGMIHISELSYNFVKDINEVLKIQDTIKAKVIKIDERGRIDLSLKQTMEPPAQPSRAPRQPIQARPFVSSGRRDNFRPRFSRPSPADNGQNTGNDIGNINKEIREVRNFRNTRETYRERESRPEEADSFEKKMASFLKTSEAKITDLNSRKSARSGRTTRRRNTRD